MKYLPNLFFVVPHFHVILFCSGKNIQLSKTLSLHLKLRLCIYIRLVLSHFFHIPIYLFLCYVGHCHHSMACPQVVDGGDGLQIWRVAINILNKQ
jgi:hypothetical protein